MGGVPGGPTCSHKHNRTKVISDDTGGLNNAPNENQSVL